MSTSNTRLIRLLDRGFYPIELPPPFRTRNFGKVRNLFQPSIKYAGSTLFYDGGTFRGQIRQFGIINPINYFLLARFLAHHWPDITAVYRLSAFTGSRPKFPALGSPGRAIQDASIAEKRRNQQHLAGSFPIVLALDINQFYGSIYTHSIPWAVLEKRQAKLLFRSHSLQGHWSDNLDRLVRNCNQQQTIGIPIGPDTSRIISELILSRIDTEIVAKGTGIGPNQVYHNIDDYQIGISDIAAAEEAQSRFVRTISQYELRLNDFKTSVHQGMDSSPSNFRRHFDVLDNVTVDNFVEHFFEILYSQISPHSGANVLGYALKRFTRKLVFNPKEALVREYLQRLIFASPYQARWILPLLLQLYQKTSVNAEVKRLLVWGIETCSRRNDISSLRWFMYSAIFMQVNLNRAICHLCFELANELVDLVLFHGRDVGLFKPPINKLRDRYRDSDFLSASWLPLYEIGRRGRDSSNSFAKIGTTDDQNKLYEQLSTNNVEFYLTDEQYFTVNAFEGWDFADKNGTSLSQHRSEDIGRSFLERLADQGREFHSGPIF